MSGPIRTILQRFWSAMTEQKHLSGVAAAPGTVVHDPAAQRPHDLDDPFFDQKVQRRFADVISHSMRDKRY